MKILKIPIPVASYRDRNFEDFHPKGLVIVLLGMQIQRLLLSWKGQGILLQEKTMDELKNLRLTQTVKGAGWASKLGPGDLDKALCELPLIQDPNLIVGFEKADDAGVYKITDELALIQTVDFFTPVVDDPYIFGQIAAANALSDVYAMGGKPLTAMNVVCFPIKTLDIGVLKAILRGGLDKLIEAETTLVGGHSVENNEIKYGLSVTGIIHPGKVLTNMSAHIGDYLILTKPLGTGIINTAIKGGMAGKETISMVSNTMVTLNKGASIAMQEVGVSACTDITGFGLLGHLSEMIRGNGFGMIVYAGKVPYFSEAKEFATKGMVPGGTYRNKEFFSQWVRFDSTVPQYLQDIFFDPQTSGGLLISVPREKVDSLLAQLREKNVNEAVIIGEVVAEPKEKIIVT